MSLMPHGPTGKPIAFAHRGGTADADSGDHLVPNTIGAFRYAWDQGVMGLEADVNLTSDGVVVLAPASGRHFGLRRRRLGHTRDQALSERGVTRLGDVYKSAPGSHSSCEVSLSVQTTEAAAAAIEVAMEASALSRLWIRSDDQELLSSLAEAGCAARLMHSVQQRIPESGFERYAAELHKTRIAAVRIRHDWLSLGLVTLFHRFNMAVVAYGARERRHIRAMARIGVNGVSSDYARRLADEVRSLASEVTNSEQA